MGHILIVEDNQLVSEALRTLFEAAGHRVSVAASVAQAITVADLDRPELTLLDLTLPDGDGLAVARHLRATDSGGVIVALTGREGREIENACTAAGCETVLLKPVPIRTLLARVEEWVGAPIGAQGKPEC